MFHDKLRRLRKNKKMSQDEMAELLGMTRQGYAKYENDQSEPSFETLRKIADYFDVTTDYLLGREQKVGQSNSNTLFHFDQLGISQRDFENLTAYQQEVLEWAVNEEALFFKNKKDNILDMLEQLEIAYEVRKAMEKRKK